MNSKFNKFKMKSLYFKLATEEYTNKLVQRSYQKFERQRNVDISKVISSSYFIKDLFQESPNLAISKAIQSIRRHKDKDDIKIISDQELIVLTEVRKNLERQYWKFFREDQIQAEIFKLNNNKRWEKTISTFKRNMAKSFENRGLEWNELLTTISSQYFSADSVNSMKLKSITECFLRYDKKPLIDRFANLIHAISKALILQQPLVIAQFVCLNIDSDQLFTKYPENYVSTVVKNVALKRQLKTLLNFIGDLYALFNELEVKLFLADTDANECVFPSILRKPISFDKVDNRFSLYEKSFREKFLGLSEIPFLKVIRWSRFETMIAYTNSLKNMNSVDFYKNISHFYNEEEINQEVKKLSQEFSKDGFHFGIPKPSYENLIDFAYRRFIMYAKQGFILKNAFRNNNLVLIQSEMPVLLRDKMFNIKCNALIPTLWLYFAE